MFHQLLKLVQKERGDQGETRPRQKKAGLLSWINPVSRFFSSSSSFWDSEWSFLPLSYQICTFTCVYLSTGFGRKALSENFISNHEKRIKKLEELKSEIQKCKSERDELSQILDLYVNDGLNYRLNVELPVLKSQHEMRMMDMHKMTNSISDTVEKYKELIQVNNSYQ
eukprot:XP_017450829.1 PREDICTED: uncharacterized protein LOC108349419 isoform X1 [Rattus norvegicus]